MGLTKHELILRYIKNLEIGTKVSVRQIAKELEVSEGTAYRAIKESENQGIVSSIPKVGTIRIEEEEKKELEDLSLREISLIVEGDVISGADKLGMVPSKFIAGSSSTEMLDKIIDGNSLILVGDREDVQKKAIEAKIPMIITGGSSISESLLEAAKKKKTPVISCPYETFVAITMINKAVNERLRSKELVRIEDIMVRDALYLTPESTVNEWHSLAQKSGHSRFPVVDEKRRVVGIITAVDMAGELPDAKIGKIMNENVLTTKPKNLVTHLSRLLIWEGFELIPVIDEDEMLVGVVSRQDILNSFQQLQRQPQFGETIDNLTLSGFKLGEWKNGAKIYGEITQFMVNDMDNASTGTLTILTNTAAHIAVKKQFKWNTRTENFSIYQLYPIEVGEKLDILTNILVIDKKAATVEVEIYSGSELKAKALTNLKMVKK